jgi:Uma2 family endonuclease
MAVMAATTDRHGIVPRPPYTVDDLEAMPDDARYELLDGMLLVSPTPAFRHQKIAYRLHAALELVALEEFEIAGAPFAVRPSNETELQPDVFVLRGDDVMDNDRYLSNAPVLVVEVLSPSTARYDWSLKKLAYEDLGVQCYWVIDPQVPRITAFELGDAGKYVQVADVKESDPFEALRPFPVRLVLTELIERRSKR